MQKIIDSIFEKESLVLEQANQKKLIKRKVLYDVNIADKIVWFVWLRWLWKTTFLLQKRLLTKNSIYFSLDWGIFKNQDVFEIIKEIYKTYQIDTFYIDEIHFYDNWKETLKNIYDILNVKIIFSWSSMINILESSYDLSRRVVIYNVPVFSFKEFLEIKKDIKIEKITFTDILHHHFEIARKYSNIYSKTIFEEYLQFWQFWYYFENKQTFEFKLENSIKKSIYEDFLNINEKYIENINKFENILVFLSNSVISEISMNKIWQKVWLNTRTSESYLNYLQKLGWVFLFDKYDNKVTNVLRKSKKICLSNTNLLYHYNLSLDNSQFMWNIRETFFVYVLKNTFKNVYYQTQTDFVVDENNRKMFFEIWWKNKKREKEVFVIKDDIIIWKEKEIPLWLFWLI